ncbi:MAG: transposase [Acidobacteriaceae bacterium]|nr:transposase [Acidobacteriaceae bacterium]
MADLADIVRGEALRYLQTQCTTSEQRKALRDIARCRTAAMGSVTVACEQCSAEYRLFCSCRNRSCPQCQGRARRQWLEARREELLPVAYLHVVFTAPRALNQMIPNCAGPLYDLVMRAAGQAVVEVGWSELGLRLGCLTQLHTWGRNMARHVHVHCLVPCGGFAEDGRRWVSFAPEDLPTEPLSARFYELLARGVRTAAREGTLELPSGASLAQLLAACAGSHERVYAKPPFGGPEKLLEYLARYTYRVAITNERIESYEEHRVTFRWRDNRRCTLGAQEFMRRFLLHVPPRGFVRIRSYGFLGNRNRKRNVQRARELIGRASEPKVRGAFTPIRLCPTCAERNGRTIYFAAEADLQPQVGLPLRAPPTQPVAA